MVMAKLVGVLAAGPGVVQCSNKQKHKKKRVKVVSSSS